MKPEGIAHVKGAIRTIEAEAQRKKHHGDGVVAAAVEKDVLSENTDRLAASLQLLKSKEVRKMHNKAPFKSSVPPPAHGRNVRRNPGMKQPTHRALSHTKMHSVARTTM